MKFIKYSFFTAIVLILISCENGKNNKTDSSPISPDPMNSEVITEEAFSKSWELMMKGKDMADNGSVGEEIIETFPEGTMFQTNENSILFFIEGSVPMLIELSKDQILEKESDGNPNIYQQSIQLPNLFTTLIGTEMVSENDEVDVVASHKGEDNRQDKKALLMSPYLIDFGRDDDNYIVNEILSKNKNYKGNIDYKKHNLSLADYENFGDYDLVNLSTHGINFCDEITIILGDKSKENKILEKAGCRTFIVSGVKHGFKNVQEALDFINSSNYGNLLVISEKAFLLRNTFFEHFYGNGLKNKIWYFSACELGLKTNLNEGNQNDLQETMKNIHQNGHFFSWSSAVDANDARTASKLFYTNLIDKGLDAKKSFEKIPKPKRQDLWSERKVIRDGITITKKSKTSLLHLKTGEPRHGIEVIEMQHPEENRTLEEGDLYPVVGDFGDGNNEALTLEVKLIGYTQAEFEEQQMSLSLKVDDKTVLNKRIFLPDMENDDLEIKSIPGNEYGVQVRIKDIAIPDLGDKTEMTLKVYLYFDGNRFSIHKEKVKLKAEGILAELKEGSETIYFYYDDENKAMRMEANDSPNDMYFDGEGYMYFYNEEGNSMIPFGWVKSKSMSSMFIGEYSFSPVLSEDHVNDNAGQFNFPIIAWAINYREKHFEQNSNFEKQKVDCGKLRKCSKFVGTVGQEAGHYALFDPTGRLIKMGQGTSSVEYTYGFYGVQLPKAQEISMPFNFN